MERGVFFFIKKKSVESLLIGSKPSEPLKEVCQNCFVWRGSAVALAVNPPILAQL